MADDKLRLAKALEKKAIDEGFSAVGIAPATLAPETRKRLQQWLAQGRQGDMLWMANRADERSDPKTLWPEVETVVMLGMSYAPATDPFALEGVSDHGRISVYAQGRDYHDVVKGALKRTARWLVEQAECEVKVFVDTAPVMEKPLAEAAGLGWQGKHTNVVSRDHGSWLFLGAIYTTLELEPSKPGKDSCGSCSACQDICPTGAFPAPYQLDARACISYLTIEHKGPIPHKYRKAIGNHIYGCDDCLAVCPWNKFAQAGAANKAFLPRAELAAPALVDILALDDAGFRQVFSGSPIKRTGRNRMVRNALIAAGNSGDAALIAPVQALLDDGDEVIREAAGWALDQLASAQP
ncbi:tRNA epoxyqueuosine(34) reductase QueG [Parasphingorhabdus sp.]|uniref:tRNA epoxyqueuosine(34) reductase QueG n=1 Tax=Parasphingorhabdus sp. TaxID=2709688 RepID=UPI0030022A1D